MPPPQDVQATFCATLVDEWVRAGVLHAVICPGSRSTPLALALLDRAAHGDLAVHVHHDERSAGFLALGLALASGEPSVVLTTSGTAAVEVHPAVVEAHLAGVPLIVCTADRPAELVDVGAPQAIDQTHLFGRSVRWFHEPGVADDVTAPRWRTTAARAVAEATGDRPGPVHLNLAFREPLVGRSGSLPPGRATGPWAWRAERVGIGAPPVRLAELAGQRGVLVAGPGSGPGHEVDTVARALGWPVLAAPQAEVWGLVGASVTGADAIVRTAPDHLRPEVVVRLGGSLASRLVGEWLASSGAPEIVIAGAGRWDDPHASATVVVPASPAEVLEHWRREASDVAPAEAGAWRAAWEACSTSAADAIESTLAAVGGLTEPGVARSVVEALPDGAHLVVSSSMPIRDLEWYGTGGRLLRVHANRGANGIDGVVSTAVGVAAATRAPTALLIGDVAFLHDTNGLLGAAQRGIDLVVMVVDNDGGGIFSFLPQAEVVAPDRFELVYGTPHGLDLAAVAAAHGAEARVVDDVGAAVAGALAAGGVHVLVARTDRADNVGVHRQINAAVAEALTRPDS
ncbi:MAG: 2-succinyl-5-enolpyruvyl-6-hydroxy-3-cyclohexene-1-carboxylic-acid synthase [Acidimicrobiales bacterium]